MSIQRTFPATGLIFLIIGLEIVTLDVIPKKTATNEFIYACVATSVARANIKALHLLKRLDE